MLCCALSGIALLLRNRHHSKAACGPLPPTLLQLCWPSCCCSVLLTCNKHADSTAISMTMLMRCGVAAAAAAHLRKLQSPALFAAAGPETSSSAARPTVLSTFLGPEHLALTMLLTHSATYGTAESRNTCRTTSSSSDNPVHSLQQLQHSMLVGQV